jgi:hypothetical protein
MQNTVCVCQMGYIAKVVPPDLRPICGSYRARLFLKGAAGTQARLADQHLQLAARIGGGEYLEPHEPEQGSRQGRCNLVQPGILHASYSLGGDHES